MLLELLTAIQLHDYNCKVMQADPNSTVQVESFQITNQDQSNLDVTMQTNFGVKEYKKNPYSIDKDSAGTYLTTQNDDFSIALSLEEDTVTAALYPLIVDGKSYGPFYYACEITK